MQIPQDVIINSITDSFETQRIYIFKNREYSNESPAHYHIAIKTKNDDYIVLLLISSQIEKRQNYYKQSNKKLLKSLIFVDNTQISLLKKQSLIDCNQVLYCTKDEIKNIAIDFRVEINFTIDKNLKPILIEAILLSPKIKEVIKQSLR